MSTLTDSEKENIQLALRTAKVEVTFEKVCGDIATRTFTLNRTFIEESTGETYVEKESKRAPNPDVCVAYQLNDAQGWRSFRWDKFKGFRVLSV